MPSLVFFALFGRRSLSLDFHFGGLALLCLRTRPLGHVFLGLILTSFMKGIATRNKCLTGSNKKLLGAPGLTRNKDATSNKSPTLVMRK